MLGALFGFRGRLSRPGFWEVVMSVLLIDVALMIGRMYVADGGLPGGFGPSSQLSQAVLAAAPWVLVIFSLWSLLAATVKRLHDRNRPGLMILIVLIPVFGWLWLLVDLFLLGGTEGKNRYGRAPHAPHAPEAVERGGFDWGDAAAEPAAAAPRYAMLDPEPAYANPEPQPHALAPDPEPEVRVHDVPAHAEVAEAVPAPEPAHYDEPAPVDEIHLDEVHAVHEPVEAHAADRHEPEPDHGHAVEAEEPFDPLNAPLVLNLR